MTQREKEREGERERESDRNSEIERKREDKMEREININVNYAMLCTLGYVKLCHIMSCYAMWKFLPRLHAAIWHVAFNMLCHVEVPKLD